MAKRSASSRSSPPMREWYSASQRAANRAVRQSVDPLRSRAARVPPAPNSAAIQRQEAAELGSVLAAAPSDAYRAAVRPQPTPAARATGATVPTVAAQPAGRPSPAATPDVVLPPNHAAGSEPPQPPAPVVPSLSRRNPPATGWKR